MQMLRAGTTIALLSIAMVANPAAGQDFPVRPIRIVTGGQPGGGDDFAARQLAQGLSGPLGQQLVVINQPVTVATDTVLRAAADGYTLLVSSSGFWTSPFFEKAAYDPLKDFSPISLVSRSPNVLVINPSLPATSVKELVALAKSRPGQLNYTNGSIGGSQHLSAELFKLMAGVDIVRIDYKGFAPQLADMMAGRVQMSFASTANAMPHVKSGKLRGLAVTTPRATELVPGLPAVAEVLPGYEAGQLVGLFAPARLPEAVMRRLNQETNRLLASPAIRDLFLRSGAEPGGGSSEEFAALIRTEMTRVGEIISNAGITVN